MNEHGEVKYRLDLDRTLRTNIPEVVYAPSKDDATLVKIVEEIFARHGAVLITKCSSAQQSLLSARFNISKHDKISGIVAIRDHSKPSPEIIGSVAVVSAGASDIPIAEEASITCEFLGLSTTRHYDCGVAGIHRTEDVVRAIHSEKPDVVIVIAGMDGALPSVIGGKLKQPIVAVPTSIGYGTGLGGVSALLTMLNSCVPGTVVANIDNGFGAGVHAYKIIKWFR